MGIRNLSTASISTGAKRSKFWDQSTSLSGYYSIASGVVDASGSATVTFSSIPQTYKHLQLRITARSSYSYSVDDAYIQLNGDTSSAYGSHNFYGASPFSSAIQVNQSQTTDAFNWGQAGGMGTDAVGQWGVAIIDILDYANTTRKKTLRSTSGMSTNSQPSAGIGGRVGNGVGFYNSTNAINQITIKSVGARPFNQYSHFALYGIV